MPDSPTPLPQSFVEQFNTNLKSTLGGAIGVRLLTAGGGRATGELLFSPMIRQVTGLIHAGALITLGDTIATPRARACSAHRAGST